MTTTAAEVRPADPMPAAALGMWLFLASEAMFFAGLLSGFLVLQSSPAERELFIRSARVVSLPLTITAVALLATSAVLVWRRSNAGAVAGLAIAFLFVQGWACERLIDHRTIVTQTAVYDGRWSIGGHFVGVRAPLPATCDLGRMLPADLSGTVGNQDVRRGDDARANAGYGPSRNNYFACYFLVTAAHAAHVVGGLAALAWLIARTRRGTVLPVHAHAVAMYWQFVNGVGLLALVVLALG